MHFVHDQIEWCENIMLRATHTSHASDGGHFKRISPKMLSEINQHVNFERDILLNWFSYCYPSTEIHFPRHVTMKVGQGH